VSTRLRSALLAASALVALLIITLLILGSGAGKGKATSQPPATGATEVQAAAGFDGAALPAGLPVHGFTLDDVLSGQPVSLARYRGHVVVLAFPYSTCGATCTLLAQQIRGALDELPRAVPVLFVSADPSADSRSHVARFLAGVSLNGRVRFLSARASQLAAVWRAYGVAPASAGATAYASRAAVFLLGPDGRERVVFGLEQLTPEGLAHDICKLSADCG
jgi:protein SCO1